MKILTVGFLKHHNACLDGINFAIRNKLIGLPVEFLQKQSSGDFGEYIHWLLNLPKIVCDERGNILYEKRLSGVTFKYEYDDNNNKIAVHLPGGTSFWFTYDEHGNMLTRKSKHGITHFEHDQHGNKTSVIRHNGEKCKYTYNEQGWRETKTTPAGRVFQYTYDEIGNHTTSCHDGKIINQWHYKYHDNGQLHTVHNYETLLLEIPLYTGN